MCVILYCESTRLNEEQVEKAFSANDDGAGIAWRQNKQVHWKKGLDLDAIKKLAATLPLPYVAHFRIASCGGVTPDLCHPFAVDKSATSLASGTFKGYVLFHNGHWANWRASLLDSTIRANLPVPDGKWSDSRTMALMASRYGKNVLEVLDEKVVIFGPDDQWFFSKGWSKVGDIVCSNTTWDRSNNYYASGSYKVDLGYTTIESSPAKPIKESGGAPEETTFCNGHRSVQGRSNGQKDVQEVSTSLSTLPEQPKVAAVSQEAIEAWKWARKLNPKTYANPA